MEGVGVRDDELTAAAAKAAGNTLVSQSGQWKPLADDGDALRLAVALGLCVEVDLEDALTRIKLYGEVLLVHMHFDGGAEAATRRSIVRAAAEIGRRGC